MPTSGSRASRSSHARRPSADAVYRSGVAARLAGVPVETLRVWERRYQVVGPQLSARGRRLYTAEEVQRLGLIKQLVDLGNPVSVLAPLSDQALTDMRQAARAITTAAGNESPDAPSTVRVALVGEYFTPRIVAELQRGGGLDVLATCPDAGRTQSALDGTRADVVVIELPALLESSVAAVETARRAAHACAAVVLYRFGQRETIQRLRRAECVVARMPPDPTEIEALCRAALVSGAARPREPGPVPRSLAVSAPRFDDAALSELAYASNSVYCECPRHLVEILRMLGSFERYSGECENRSPADAALHRDLKATATEARVLIEAALVRVARAEGLPLPLPRQKAQA